VQLDESFKVSEKAQKMSELVTRHYPLLAVFQEGSDSMTDNDLLYPAVCEYVLSVDRKFNNMEHH